MLSHCSCSRPPRRTDPRQGPALVIGSRVGGGRVIPGTEYTTLGMVPEHNLNPQKARIPLTLALT